MYRKLRSVALSNRLYIYYSKRFRVGLYVCKTRWGTTTLCKVYTDCDVDDKPLHFRQK